MSEKLYPVGRGKMRAATRDKNGFLTIINPDDVEEVTAYYEATLEFERQRMQDFSMSFTRWQRDYFVLLREVQNLNRKVQRMKNANARLRRKKEEPL